MASIGLISVNFFYMSAYRERARQEEAYDYPVILLPGT